MWLWLSVNTIAVDSTTRISSTQWNSSKNIWVCSLAAFDVNYLRSFSSWFVDHRSSFFGFLLNYFAHWCTIFPGMFFFCHMVQFFCGIYLYLRSFCEDIRRIFDKIDAQPKNGAEVSRLLVSAVEFHTKIIEYCQNLPFISIRLIQGHFSCRIFGQSKAFTSPIVFFEIFSGTIFLTISFFQFDFVCIWNQVSATQSHNNRTPHFAGIREVRFIFFPDHLCDCFGHCGHPALLLHWVNGFEGLGRYRWPSVPLAVVQDSCETAEAPGAVHPVRPDRTENVWFWFDLL